MGNVLLIGNSGVGKSTLLNAVLGEEAAITGFGISGTTKECKRHGDENSPFYIIDTMGFEPTWWERRKAVKQIQKWSEDSAEMVDSDTRINVIWFCVDGTSSKLFSDAIKSMDEATRIWKTVPIVVVITKSYSKAERTENIEMVKKAIANNAKLQSNVKAIVPVVAGTYIIDDDTFVTPSGIDDLTKVTLKLMPEGEEAALKDAANFKIGRKRALSQTAVVAATISAATTGAIPVPELDTLAIMPIVRSEAGAIAKIFGIEKNEEAKKFIDSIADASNVALAAKGLVGALKMVPGLNLPAAILNAITSGAIVAAIGEGSIIAFEKISRGEEKLSDLDWIEEFMKSILGSVLTESATEAAESLGENASATDVATAVLTNVATPAVAAK